MNANTSEQAPRTSTESEGPHATPRLIAEQATLVAGTSGLIGVTFKIEPHWHVYWRGQNTAGMAPSITWGLPKGVAVGEIQWPAPERKLQPGADDIVSYIYENQVTLLVPVITSPDLAGSTITLHAALEWLVCAEGCVLESANATLTLPVVAAGQKVEPTVDVPLFEATRKRLPQAWTPASDAVRVKIEKNHVKIDAKDATSVAFHPDEAGVTILNAPTSGFSKTGSLDMEFEASANANELFGIVEITRKGEQSPAWYAVRVPIAGGAAMTAAPTAGVGSGAATPK